VAEVVYSRRAFSDPERLVEFLVKDAPRAAIAAIDLIRDGIGILGRHPLIGRPCEEGLRELLISYGKSGYLALYSFEQKQDFVLLLAIRYQREAADSAWNDPLLTVMNGRYAAEQSSKNARPCWKTDKGLYSVL
jgi:plasmid stabilization system protein ParE